MVLGKQPPNFVVLLSFVLVIFLNAYFNFNFSTSYTHFYYFLFKATENDFLIVLVLVNYKNPDQYNKAWGEESHYLSLG